MKKTIFTIVVYLVSLSLFFAVVLYISSEEWYADPTDLQMKIFAWFLSAFFLGCATSDLVSLLPWDQIRQKIFRRKSPPPADPE